MNCITRADDLREPGVTARAAAAITPTYAVDVVADSSRAVAFCRRRHGRDIASVVDDLVDHRDRMGVTSPPEAWQRHMEPPVQGSRLLP